MENKAIAQYIDDDEFVIIQCKMYVWTPYYGVWSIDISVI